jgi:hypothetical protein
MSSVSVACRGRIDNAYVLVTATAVLAPLTVKQSPAGSIQLELGNCRRRIQTFSSELKTGAGSDKWFVGWMNARAPSDRYST